MKRESGYYWVKVNDGWWIAQYIHRADLWYMFAQEQAYRNRDFQEIDERKIERQP